MRTSATRPRPDRDGPDAAVGTAVVLDPSCRDHQEVLMTALMEEYRVTRTPQSFERLFAVAGPILTRRIRHRLRRSGCDIDEADVLQETLVNVYRYPDHFRCDRTGAFKAWSGAILENAIRRLLRRRVQHREIFEGGNDLLDATPSRVDADPVFLASAQEDQRELARSWAILLAAYLDVFQTLSARERQALHLVEGQRLRYREVARHLDVRPEALKMVVFRARKRILLRLTRLLAGRPPAIVAN